MAGREKTKNSVVAHRIKNLRKREKLTQAQLGSMLFKSESTVRMWELGKSEPDIDTLNNLATIFGVSVDFIMGNSDIEDTTTFPLPSKVLSSSFPFTPQETALVIAYRAHPNEQAAVNKLLDVPTSPDEIILYNAAYFGDKSSEGFVAMPADEWERLKNTPVTDQDLS